MPHKLTIIQVVLTVSTILAAAAVLPAQPKPTAKQKPAPKPAIKEEGTLAAYNRAVYFGSDRVRKLVYKLNVDAHWIGETPTFWYVNEVRGEKEFLLVDAAAATRVPAFDHAKLAKSLSQAAGKTYDAKHLPFSSINFSEDGKSIVFGVDTQGWKCDLSTYACTKAESAPAPTPGPGRRPNAPEEEVPAATPAAQSPDGRMEAVTRDNNVFLKAKDTGKETQLCTDGTAEDYYSGVAWSPDSKYVAAWKCKPGSHPQMYVVESSPDGTVRPKLHQSMYELPGDTVDVFQLYLFDAENGKQIKVDCDPVDWWGPLQLTWRKDSKRFTYEQLYRGYQRQQIVDVDAATGHTRILVDQRSNTFIWPPCQYSHYMEASEEIIWASERDGWCHLYLVDWNTGQVKNQITTGQWVVRGVESVDEKTRQILFTACGHEPGQDPYLIHYYRINFDGTGLVSLTPGNGQHSVRWSPDKQYYIDTYSLVNVPPVSELRKASDGSLVMKLEQADVKDLLATGWKFPEPFVAKDRSGKYDIYGVIYRPSNLDPKKKYPVIEDIYAGPQGSFVPKNFTAVRGDQALTELGFIVVQIDGLGTANRSKVFHDVCYKNLGDSGFPDRIIWMKRAALKYPYIDVSRVGIFGTSAGGYNAAHALIAHPEFYKVAVSQAGNHDHRTDKVWWNELWMGYPIGPHYAEQSNIVNAAKMKGKLLLVHGELDDNVNPSASTLQFVNSLIKANKDFDLLIVPGAKHGNFGTYGQRRLWDYFVRNLRHEDPPSGFEIKTAANVDVNITIKNLTDKPVDILWVDTDGKLQKYPAVAPGQSVQRHTFTGHQWEAHLNGKPVAWYTASTENPTWTIGPLP